MKLYIEDFEQKDLDDMTSKEIVSEILSNMKKLDFKPVDLDKSIFNQKGKDTYYKIFDAVHDALGGNGQYYMDRYYPISIDGTQLFVKPRVKSIVFAFPDSGKLFTITKFGNTSIDSRFTRRDALYLICGITRACLRNE
jgi:hypothetical protein